MPERNIPRSNSRKSFSRRAGTKKSLLCRANNKSRKLPIRVLSRSVSEPILKKFKSLYSDNNDSDDVVSVNRRFGFSEQLFIDEVFYASTPLLPFPPLHRSVFKEDAKVVVNVTVEGSPGPVQAMVKLGATVNDTIEVVVDQYRREGRSPKLTNFDSNTDSFQLHHSHFSLKSLNKNNKIGEVGSRSFYLRKSCSSSNSFNSANEETYLNINTEIEHIDGRIQTLAPTHLFFSFITKRLSKIKRRTKRLLRLVACIPCL